MVESQSNFLLVKLNDANPIFNELRNQGIVLRDQSRQPTLDNCIRITVGTEAENRRLLDALLTLLTETC